MFKFLKLIVVLLVLLVIAAIAVFFYIDRIAKTAIERGSTYALGVETTLVSADVGVFGGQLELQQLNVENPQGFGSDHFLDLKSGDVQVTLNSLRQEVVHVPRLNLDGIDVNLEKKAGQSNYRVILDNLKKLQGDSTKEGKRFIIDELTIRDVDVHVNMLDKLPGANLGKVNVPIGEIKLREVGAKGGRGVTIGELSGLILKAVLASAVEKGAGLIPDDIASELRGKLAELADLDRLLKDIDLGELEKKAGELGVPKDVTDKAKDELDKAGDKLKDLLGGDKKKQ